jgi:PleD family two-component response regulator
MSTPVTVSADDAPIVVLLVDDQAFVAEVVRRFFSTDPQIEFHACTDPNEAIRTANLVQPTVILQDLVMPGVDGMAIVGQFRANPATKDTPIIVLSSKEEGQTKSLAFTMGANDYLVKLPEPLELLARVRYHSKAYVLKRQRDEAFRALRESQQQLMESNEALIATNRKLGEALTQVRQLSGLLPMCAYCRRVRDDKNYWGQIEAYLAANSNLKLSHGVCDDCFHLQARDLGLSPEAAEAVRNRIGLKIAPPAEGESASAQ